MGSYNAVCQITHRPILENEPCVLVFITKANYSSERSSMLIYNTDNYVPASLPFHVIYDDYGKYRLNPDFEYENSVAFDLMLSAAAGTTIPMDIDRDFMKRVENDMSAEEIKENAGSLLSIISESHFQNPTLQRFLEGVSYENFEDLFDKLDSEKIDRVSYMAFNQTAFDNLTQTKVNQPVSYFSMDSRTRETKDNLLEAVQEYYNTYEPAKFSAWNFERPNHFELLSIGGLQSVSELVPRWFYTMLTKHRKENSDAVRVYLIGRLFYEALIELHIPYGLAMYGGQSHHTKTIALTILSELQSLRKEFENDIYWSDISYDDMCGIYPEFKNILSKEQFHYPDTDIYHNAINQIPDEAILNYYKNQPNRYM